MSFVAFIACAWPRCRAQLDFGIESGHLPDYVLAPRARARGWSVRLYGYGNTRCPDHKGRRRRRRRS